MNNATYERVNCRSFHTMSAKPLFWYGWKVSIQDILDHADWYKLTTQIQKLSNRWKYIPRNLLVNFQYERYGKMSRARFQNIWRKWFLFISKTPRDPNYFIFFRSFVLLWYMLVVLRKMVLFPRVLKGKNHEKRVKSRT